MSHPVCGSQTVSLQKERKKDPCAHWLPPVLPLLLVAPPLLQLNIVVGFMTSKLLSSRAHIRFVDLEAAALQAVHASGPHRREDGSLETALPCHFLSPQSK